MEIVYKNFDIAHIPDNEAQYFNILSSIIGNIDQFSYFVITKNPNSYTFRLSTSIPIVNPIIKQINLFNNSAGVKAVFSKSMKNGSIFWQIQI